jgi:NADH-quinone oxidoreductase subunit G
MIEIEIDGKKLEVAPGSMIIEAADAAGIRIPRFCYHKKLSIAANCRMCLIEVDKVGKPLPACATPVTPGMKILTQSAKAIDAQQSVMEFLLINHPLDCPICDQGGACELQDISMGYGKDFSRYDEEKRAVQDENLGSLIATEMTRCIQCTRCVRFGQEIAGVRELGTLGRHDRMEIGTYLKDQAIRSELSGNVIDLCPVGALTSKPFRFTARAWELDQFPSISCHDAVGSNIFVQTRRGKVMRVIPRENENINEVWISDRDRFSYQALYASDRLTMPLIKNNGEWQECDWATALNFTIAQLKNVKEKYGANEIAAFASPNSTLEEFYLLQKVLRGLGCHNIDHRLHQTDVSDQAQMPLFPQLNISIEQLQDQELIVLVGTHINHEHPMLAHRIRKAFLQGAKILCINPYDYEFGFQLAEKNIVAPQLILQQLQAILEHNHWHEYFKQAQKKIIILGALAFDHPHAAAIRHMVQGIAEKYTTQIGYLPEGANSAGAWIAGCLPHRAPAGETVISVGHAVNNAIHAKLRSYLLFNIEPELDCAQPHLAMQSLHQAECVVAFSAYRAHSLLTCANVILPIAPFAENSGTFVNCEGRWQNFSAITPASGEARPAWKILRVLGNLLQMPGFVYVSSEQIRDEVEQLIKPMLAHSGNKFIATKLYEANSNRLQRITEWPIYRGDMLVRRGQALQDSATNETLAIRINQKTARELGLQQNQLVKIQQEGGEAILPITIDSAVPDHGAVVYAGYPETSTLGSNSGELQLTLFENV